LSKWGPIEGRLYCKSGRRWKGGSVKIPPHLMDYKMFIS
jgi:hypothetical protein